MSSGLLPEQRDVWRAALRLGRFTFLELEEASGSAAPCVRHLMRRLQLEGVVETVAMAERQRHVFRVARPEAYPETVDAPQAPQAGPATPEGQMWTAMRGLLQFAPRELAAHAGTEEVSVGETDAVAYCRLLLRAGYLRVVRKAIPGRVDPVYRLLRNTGPRPPRERRVTGLYDANSGEFVVPPGAVTGRAP